MFKINDPERRLTGKPEKIINAPDGITVEIGKSHYNIRETPAGVVIRKVSFDETEAVTIQANAPNQITIK